MHKRHLVSTIVAGLLISLSDRSEAAAITVLNPSFESPSTPPGTFIASMSSGPTNWSIYGTQNSSRTFGVLNPNSTTLYSDPVPAGNNVGVVFLFNQGVGEGGLQQTLSSTLQLNTQYTLTLNVGNIKNDPNPPHNAFNFTGFPGYRIDLLAGSTVLASDNNTLSIPEGAFRLSTVTFNTGASHANQGQALGIRLVNLNGSGIEVNFDNVQLNAVPEPSTWAMLGLGFGALALLAKRRALR